MNDLIRVVLAGDVMLGRLVKEIIPWKGIDYPMGAIAPLLRRGDLTIINLECAITTNTIVWPYSPKAFYFGAPPEAAEILSRCHVKLVSLANNHILDFDVEGLLDTLKFLNDKNIFYAGAGINMDEAYAPAIVEVKKKKFGMVAFCDHQADFAATQSRPGMAFIDLYNEQEVLEQFQFSLKRMQAANVDWPILSLHWGPNMVNRPSKEFVRIAHAAIDMGYKILFGHSAHVFHGIEIYRNCPIIYAAGDLVDDYYVDPEFKNDHQLIFELEISGQHLQRIILHPVFIENCQTFPASSVQSGFIAGRAQELCAEFGTKVTVEGSSLLIKL